MDIHAILYQFIAFSLFSQKRSFFCKLLDLHVQALHFFISEIIDLLEHRIQKLLDTVISLKKRAELRRQFRKFQFLLQPSAQIFIQDGLIYKIKIMIKIVAKFLQGINICADILDIIRNLRFFCLA